jgi:hypothetical protein
MNSVEETTGEMLHDERLGKKVLGKILIAWEQN